MINIRILKNYLSSNSASGVILICGVVISLILSNSHFEDSYSRALEYQIGFNNESIHLRYSVLSWINEGLMALFFLLIGLEIKREMITGEFSSIRKAALPVIAAFGGAVVPAIIYYSINQGTLSAHGWGIPMATDIAFALAALSLLGTRVPSSLKVFLATLAIADDLIAIIVIAIFYSHDLRPDCLIYASAVFILMLLFGKLKIRNIWVYLIPGVILWYLIHHSGIHATIAGVLTAVTIPLINDGGSSPLLKLEQLLMKPVNLIIMPLFALANTNINLHEFSREMMTHPAVIGISAGLILGKPAGILLSAWATVKAGWGRLPDKTDWRHIAGVGILGGIGFTMSIFISLLSFTDPALQTLSKISVLLASTISGLLGYTVLRLIHKRR